ncbi:unnamed protein product [Allacma fusca]|uniref:Uncharacterized protein n=1 Tax=Allacma fusca TaxID=39272 RepID=A0A8J2JVB8_9HEXA|nr:unnamed protein product [Allacma fusca]
MVSTIVEIIQTKPIVNVVQVMRSSVVAVKNAFEMLLNAMVITTVEINRTKPTVRQCFLNLDGRCFTIERKPAKN